MCENGDEYPIPCGSAFLNAFPASMKFEAASCLLCIWRCKRAAWENAFPAAGKQIVMFRKLHIDDHMC